jgi:6-phosphofructokinase
MNKDRRLKRVAILFAGGPAPAANAVISTAAMSFLRNDIQVVGIMHGYENLQKYRPDYPMQVGRDYVVIEKRTLSRSRNAQGIMIGTSRVNPGKQISQKSHFENKERVESLRSVYDALGTLEVDALVSIGGDDTLKTANKFYMMQKILPDLSRHIPVVHVPKTIDNDYMGIDFTFGYFTAVHTLGGEIRNLLHDAAASRSYFLAETMGRSAGWLAYGAAIAGEASMVISVEDIQGDLETIESYTDHNGLKIQRRTMKIEAVVDQIVDMMRARLREGKEYGVIVLAEGLAELLPKHYLEGISRDDHGHISMTEVNLSRLFSKLASQRFAERTGDTKKITGIQLGYESRCALPHAFDVMLGSQLGVGAYRALVEEGLDAVMVSVVGQLELRYVSFEELIDPDTLLTRVRHIQRGSDFHRLARFLETHVNT